VPSLRQSTVQPLPNISNATTAPHLVRMANSHPRGDRSVVIKPPTAAMGATAQVGRPISKYQVSRNLLGHFVSQPLAVLQSLHILSFLPRVVSHQVFW
jgi:hypothetical protein